MRPLRLEPRSVGGWRQLTVSRTTMLMVAVLMRRRCSSAAAVAASRILLILWPAESMKAFSSMPSSYICSGLSRLLSLIVFMAGQVGHMSH